MKKSKLSESQIIALLKERAAGVFVADICSTYYKFKEILSDNGSEFSIVGHEI